ncbi:HNH endonuclease [Rhizobium sp. RAF56]|uniref:HNH endonuclease n=1 Tax=Rhizobium sp. RAF56 TaxID=3233062 RepID=UPI003F9CDF29
MTDLYQPAIIKELLLHDGKGSKSQIASALAGYDLSVLEYYKAVVMRWPKITLEKHGIVAYQASGQQFSLCHFPDDAAVRDEAVRICDAKIAEWIERKRLKERAPEAGASVRYELLKEAHGKCQLCGIDRSISPMDIDHIVPRSRADKFGRVRKGERWIDVNSRENLQVLCFRCNRAKRETDDTDFRRTSKLVRDRIPEIIAGEGRTVDVVELSGPKLIAALKDKLVEEHAEFISAASVADSLAELADMIEVILAIGSKLGAEESRLTEMVLKKREERGGFSKGFFARAIT